MKRFISALALCSLLLVLLSIFLFPPVEAKENSLLVLLNLPAPPPPNPWARRVGGNRDPKFYNKSNPPKDDAPIDDVLDYWRNQHDSYRELGYNPKPSDKNIERIYAEIEKDPKLLPRFLNSLPDGERSGNFVKQIYDREGTHGVFDRGDRLAIKKWLTYHTPFFSSDLARIAQQAGDVNEYVSNQDELLALARVDYDKAKPMIDRLYGNSSQKTSQVLAKWALYRHALDSDSAGDIETYRDELKAVVEDKSATAGMRDLAFDALSKEKDWSGRDEWYYSLLGDETLAELRVNGQTYTGLTTILYYAPDEKYIDKMLELVRSDNRVVRAAAIRNLVLKLNTNNPEILRALVPWLEDPKWAVDIGGARATLVRRLSEFEIPESVPGLIKVLDERPVEVMPAANRPASNVYSNYSSAALANAMNAAAHAANAAANAVYAAANAANATPFYTSANISPPNRFDAIAALTKQKDGRAVPALRRILPEGEQYERENVVKALLACGGFSISEQLQALEVAAKVVSEEMDAEDQVATAWASNLEPQVFSNSANWAVNKAAHRSRGPLTAAEITRLLANALFQAPEISDELARAVVARIESLDKRGARLAAAFRRMILKWQNSAINLLLLSDVKRGNADADTIVRLLGQRKELREKQPGDVFDLKTGKAMGVGIASCLLEDQSDYVAILDKSDAETKTAMLACARLIRAPLPVARVAENLRSADQMLKMAAERYLESEDSPEARSFVLALYPNEARILGARTAFFVEGAADRTSEYLYMVYQSLGDDSLYNGWYGSGNDPDLKAAEKRLRDEIKKNEDLLGVYSYERNYVRIYRDRAVFSWDEDDSRYRERPLTKYEFDDLKSYLTKQKANELPPFLGCGGEYCSARELIMLGRNGGRRVYTNGSNEMFSGGTGNDFFAGLEKYFADLKHVPATLRYTLSRDIEGLEILMASDDLHAETVWKEGSDLRIAASASAVRKKVRADIDNLGEETDESENAYEEIEARKEMLREKRRFEGVSWFKLVDGIFESGAAQPSQVEFIPLRDGLAVEPSDEQWKARAAGAEIRGSDAGLFRAFGGKLTKLRPGTYDTVVVTPTGRWAVASKTNEDGGQHMVRIDLLTNKEYPVVIEGYGQRYASAYVPTLNKVLVGLDNRYDYEGYEEEDDVVPDDVDPREFNLLDPATGAVQPPAGEFRPLDQQTFRPLQKTSKTNEFWAAIYDSEKNVTDVGIYDIKAFGFVPVLRVPRIRFNSMSMWVDEAGNKVYFVYRGHLLALPLRR